MKLKQLLPLVSPLGQIIPLAMDKTVAWKIARGVSRLREIAKTFDEMRVQSAEKLCKKKDRKPVIDENGNFEFTAAGQKQFDEEVNQLLEATEPFDLIIHLKDLPDKVSPQLLLQLEPILQE